MENFEEGINIVLYLIYYRDFKDIETKQKFIVELVQNLYLYLFQTN